MKKEIIKLFGLDNARTRSEMTAKFSDYGNRILWDVGSKENDNYSRIRGKWNVDTKTDIDYLDRKAKRYFILIVPSYIWRKYPEVEKLVWTLN